MTAERTGPVDHSRTLTREENRVVWLLLCASFVTMLNETTMGVAIPHLIGDLSITAVQAQWITTAFMLTMAVIIPVTGFVLKRFTTRGVYITAMSLFSLGTLIALLAPGYPVLLAARVVQASGTAIMMPLLMTTLMTVVPAHARGRMMGRVSVVISLAPAIGPTLSGFLLVTVGWRWIFGIVLPIALLALAAGAAWVRNLGEPEHAPIDVLSIVLAALGFGGLVYGLSQIGEASGADGSASTWTLVAAFAIGIVALALFVWRQARLQRSDRALLDLRVFRVPNFSLSIGQLALLAMSFFGAITVLPLFLQDVLGFSALNAGLAVLPGAVAMGLLAPTVGRVYDRRGTRTLLIPGTIITIVMLWYFTTLDEQTTLLGVAIAYTILSIGLALSFTPLFTAALGSVARPLYSYGSAVVGSAQQVAGAAGIAVMVAVMTAATTSARNAGADDLAAGTAGAHAAFLIAALVSTPLLIGAVLIRKPADGIDAPVVH